jgi:hypothetical protein
MLAHLSCRASMGLFLLGDLALNSVARLLRHSEISGEGSILKSLDDYSL